MSDSMSFHSVSKLEIEQSGEAKHSEKSQSVIIHKEDGSKVDITAFGDFETVVGDE